ncbi:MAG: hypothetical protein KF708_19825 [Pirellulales bacterium]|nr:hypothetical protein [Pirellulales bacterium]
MDRHHKFLWMRDILEHIESCYDEWRHTEGEGERRLADMIQRDLDQCRRLCESLRGEAQERPYCCQPVGV